MSRSVSSGTIEGERGTAQLQLNSINDNPSAGLSPDPIEVRPHVRTTFAARTTNEAILNVGQPQLVRPCIAADPDLMRAMEVGAVHDHSHILAPATSSGKNILPRAAALLDCQQISEIIAVESPDTFVRPIYAGNALATVKSNDAIKVITVRTTCFDAVAPTGGSASIEQVQSPGDSGLSSFVGREVQKSERPALTSARVNALPPRRGTARYASGTSSRRRRSTPSATATV